MTTPTTTIAGRVTSVLRDPVRLRELVRYGLVGLFNAGTAFGIYAGGVLLGIPYLLAAVLAFALSASIGYLLHEYWTFQGATPTWRGLAKWLATHSAANAANLVLLALTVDVLGLDRILAQAILMPAAPLATYLVAIRWVFTRRPAAPLVEVDPARPATAPVDPVGRVS